jgi:hypothetical protein
MRVFIIRPFGTKEGIDFEQVDRELIQRALKRLEESGFSMHGGTTGEISRQGNIREDMFRMIVASDLVIADVSIHNANVFYELGIRHALRPRHTFLIRSRTKEPYPFDLQTDRYFLYDAANPSDGVADLVQALRSTLASTERDSPVFALLPGLEPHGRTKLVKVPADFQEEVERAGRDGRRGDLLLLAHEVAPFEWEQEALRLIGDAQFRLRAFAHACDTFETLRHAVPEDVQANLRLGTIYQRLALSEPPERKEDLLVRSDQAIERVLADKPALNNQVEAYCLQASNEKSRWIEDFSGAAPGTETAHALRSTHLEPMLKLYLKASNLNLNAHYPAVNALALLRVQLALAALAPQAWQEGFDNDATAVDSLKARDILASRLASSLCLALEMDEIMGRRESDPDPWAASSRADVALLTSSDRPQRVANEYRHALADANRFTLEATRRNLGIYKQLGLFEPGVSAALEVVDEAIARTVKTDVAPIQVILFTGHMIDTAGTATENMRFPPTPEAEEKARSMIEETVRKEVSGLEGSTLGIAGGACGSDIIFHEVCDRLKIRTELYLALPPEKFQITSVQRGGPDWVDRYRALNERRVPRMLQPMVGLPRWLSDKRDYDVWQRNNLWMMFNALAIGSRQLTLISLYNREREPEGPGGTAQLVEEATKWGFKSVELDARKLLAAL